MCLFYMSQEFQHIKVGSGSFQSDQGSSIEIGSKTEKTMPYLDYCSGDADFSVRTAVKNLDSHNYYTVYSKDRPLLVNITSDFGANLNVTGDIISAYGSISDLFKPESLSVGMNNFNYSKFLNLITNFESTQMTKTVNGNVVEWKYDTYKLIPSNPITLFVPTNDAITKALNTMDFTEEQLIDCVHIESMLNSHIVEVPVNLSDVSVLSTKGEQLSVNGNVLTDAYGNTINVEKTIITRDGSVIYVIDTMINVPTIGTLIKNDKKAYNGYTLFHNNNQSTTFLIDNNGSVVHHWPGTRNPGVTYLIKTGKRRGQLIRGTQDPNFRKSNPKMNYGGSRGYIEVVDWDGTVLWELKLSGKYLVHDKDGVNYRHTLFHHDVAYNEMNDSIFVQTWVSYSYDECVAAGRDKTILIDDNGPIEHVVFEQVLEVKIGEGVEEGVGNVLWCWNQWDHMIQNRGKYTAHYGNISENPQYIDMNYYNTSAVLDDPFHANGLDWNPERRELMMSVRGHHELIVISYDTKAIVYRWGNSLTYNMYGSQILDGQHDAKWIVHGRDKNKIMVFDNKQVEQTDTTVRVLDPRDYKLVDGIYEPLYPEYDLVVQRNLGSYFISGAQALPNNNILANLGPHGTFAEYDSTGKMVWRYTAPFKVAGGKAVIQSQGTSLVYRNNMNFRCYKYSVNDPMFQGRIFKPMILNTIVQDINNILINDDSLVLKLILRSNLLLHSAFTIREATDELLDFLIQNHVIFDKTEIYNIVDLKSIINALYLNESSAITVIPDSYTPGSIIDASNLKSVGTIICDNDLAFDGYNLVQCIGSQFVYLHDNFDVVHHYWNTVHPCSYAKIITSGKLKGCLVTLEMDSEQNTKPLILPGHGGYVNIYNWDSSLLISIKHSSETILSHHDFEYNENNGNLFIIIRETVTLDEMIEAGYDVSNYNKGTYGNYNETDFYTDKIIEVEIDLSTKEWTQVWEWKAWDHMIQYFDPTKSNYSNVQNDRKIDINAHNIKISSNDLFHTNSISYNTIRDEIVIDCPGTACVYVFSHKYTTEETQGELGDLLLKCVNYNTVENSLHDAKWINKHDLDSDIMYFNNGNPSSIRFIRRNNANNYNLTSTNSLYEEYVIPSYLKSVFIAGAEILENGNLYINSGERGIDFEIKTDNFSTILWLYRNPFLRSHTFVNTVDDLPFRENKCYKNTKYSKKEEIFINLKLHRRNTLLNYIESGFENRYSITDGADLYQ